MAQGHCPKSGCVDQNLRQRSDADNLLSLKGNPSTSEGSIEDQDEELILLANNPRESLVLVMVNGTLEHNIP